MAFVTGKRNGLKESEPVLMENPRAAGIHPKPVIVTVCDIPNIRIKGVESGWIKAFSPARASSFEEKWTTLTILDMRTKFSSPEVSMPTDVFVTHANHL
tara:strand:- start:405 stop:701 length:297 start_codon:yes stop_codon:yes gene_type:complete